MKGKLLWLLTNFKEDTQVIILLKSDKSEIINGKVKDIIESQTIKDHRFDIVEEIKIEYRCIVIEISLDM